MKKLSRLFQISTFVFALALLSSCAEDAVMDELIQDIEKYDASATDGDEVKGNKPPTGN